MNQSRRHHPADDKPQTPQVVSFLQEPDLAREVFRVYLGDPPVSQEAKNRLASEVPDLLNKGQRVGC